MNKAVSTLYLKLLHIIVVLTFMLEKQEIPIPEICFPPRPVLSIQMVTNSASDSDHSSEETSSAKRKKLRPISDLMEELEKSIKVIKVV